MARRAASTTTRVGLLQASPQRRHRGARGLEGSGVGGRGEVDSQESRGGGVRWGRGVARAEEEERQRRDLGGVVDEKPKMVGFGWG